MSAALGRDGYAISDDASLAHRNTLRVAATARWLVDIDDAAKLPEILQIPAIRSGPVLALGQGSNVLFVQDFPGTIISLATRGVAVEEDETDVHIVVAAGESWDDFVRWTLGQGYAGLENLVMIPGSVGAAPMQNIGAYGREASTFVEAVEAWDRTAGKVVSLSNAQCGFGYRDSVFKRAPDRYFITAVRFCLPKNMPLQLDYAGLREQLARMGAAQPTAYHVAEAVVHLRTRKLPDPAVIGNAGSFFKNPSVAPAVADRLLGEHPELPHWANPDGSIKLSAAWMIETCGCKGLRDGDAGISNRHALVLVNHGHATGAALWALAERVIHDVEDRFGVSLEPEPRVLGAAD